MNNLMGVKDPVVQDYNDAITYQKARNYVHTHDGRTDRQKITQHNTTQRQMEELPRPAVFH